MKITMYAHASFRLETDGITIITDPYTPGPDEVARPDGAQGDLAWRP